jgi:DMSO/TMAO reductase YedYZ molybdopterin-dependent catalytic subunit
MAAAAAALVAALAGQVVVATQEVHAAVIDAGAFTLPMVVDTRETEVEEVEIREYQGERLGSVDDFRENSIEGVQYLDEAAYVLVLDGLVEQPLSWSYTELGGMDHLSKLITIHCVEGWSVKALWDGIPLALLFGQARPLADANTVIFHAADGYTTSLPLDFVLERNLIIADRINGVVLPPENGFPFELVAEDKWGYKWIKWIVRIELSDDPSYRGFWESRGFSNKGDINGSKFGE